MEKEIGLPADNNAGEIRRPRGQDHIEIVLEYEAKEMRLQIEMGKEGG